MTLIEQEEEGEGQNITCHATINHEEQRAEGCIYNSAANCQEIWLVDENIR